MRRRADSKRRLSLYFTDEEKYWINWPLKSRGDIPLQGGKLFPTFRMTARRSSLRSARTCEIVLFYYGKKWDDPALEQIKNCRESP